MPNTTVINAQGPESFTVGYAEAAHESQKAITLDYLAAATTGRALTNGVVQPAAGRGGTRGERRVPDCAGPTSGARLAPGL